MSSDAHPENERRVVLYSLLLFVLFSAFFILLRSKDPLEVDGAFRCFGVFRHPQLSFAGNNHPLYPADVWIWTRLAKLIGFNITSAQSFYSVVELMNCVAAAGCLALFFQLSFMATLSTSVAVAVTLGFGFTRAFLLHAMNASEPMVGVFWSFLAVYLAARSFKTDSRRPAFFSGLFFALAMATYQTAVLLGPVAALILWRAARPPFPSPSNARSSKVLNLYVFGAGALTGCLFIYGAIALFRLHSGSAGTTTGAVISGLFQDPGARAYLGITSGKFLNLPLGFLRNCYPVLAYFAGIRGSLRGSMLSIVSIFLFLAALAALATYCVIRIASLWNLLESRTRTAILCGLVGAAFTLVPLIIWNPQYDKFWIQPLACLIFLLGISFQIISARSMHPFFFARALPALLLAGLLSNFSWVARSHANPITEMREAQRLSTIVARSDLVVGGWDGVSVLYGYAWVPLDTHFISFPDDAVSYGPQAVARLQQSVNTTLGAGGRVFFLGLLDESKQSWDSFLSLRCGVPYSAFDLYRARSVRYASLETRFGPLVLKRLDLRSTPQPGIAGTKNAKLDVFKNALAPAKTLVETQLTRNFLLETAKILCIRVLTCPSHFSILPSLRQQLAKSTPRCCDRVS